MTAKSRLQDWTSQVHQPHGYIMQPAEGFGSLLLEIAEFSQGYRERSAHTYDKRDGSNLSFVNGDCLTFIWSSHKGFDECLLPEDCIREKLSLQRNESGTCLRNLGKSPSIRNRPFTDKPQSGAFLKIVHNIVRLNTCKIKWMFHNMSGN